MNIRVDLNTPIKDGTEVVFRSPVDCSQITGLIVYYQENGNTASKEFAFADAHGNDVGYIDHLFAENAVVKVILDLDANMAFVQNADTNAYIEGRFKETIDKCCPPLNESGSVVACEPVEGYPLTVTAQPEATKVTRCGKNLFCNLESYNNTNSGLETTRTKGDSFTVLNGTCTQDASIRLVTAFPIKAGTYMVSVHGANKLDDGHDRLYVPVNGGTGVNYVMTGAPKKLTIDKDTTLDVNLIIKAGSTYNNAKVSVQIEAGNTATEFEQHTSETFAPGETIPALPGVNTLFADSGNITVTGKANPSAIIEKLTNAIVALGGNV